MDTFASHKLVIYTGINN